MAGGRRGQEAVRGPPQLTRRFLDLRADGADFTTDSAVNREARRPGDLATRFTADSAVNREARRPRDLATRFTAYGAVKPEAR